MADNQNSNTSNRGFASMDEDKQREIASKGGKAAHESGHAHEFNSEEAAEAGRKGGETVSRDRQHMAEIGREGGQNSHGGSNASDSDDNSGSSNRGGSHEQHVKAGQQSHKNS